nr:hypothetical protein [Candidatus Electrothrix aestuarii]
MSIKQVKQDGQVSKKAGPVLYSVGGSFRELLAESAQALLFF